MGEDDIYDITTAEFSEDKLEGHRYFLLNPLKWLYVTNEVEQAVREAGLTGIDFRPVWSSDEA